MLNYALLWFAVFESMVYGNREAKVVKEFSMGNSEKLSGHPP